MKEKKKLAWLAGLLVVAAFVWYTQRNKPLTGGGTTVVSSQLHLLPSEGSDLRIDKLLEAQSTEYKSNGRNIFSVVAPPSPAEVAKTMAAAQNPGPPPPPPPPPPPTLPAKFYGYGTIPNGTAKRAFLTSGEDIYIVSEGDTLLGRYRIIKINATNLEFEEVATGRRNTAPLEEQASSGPAA